MRALHGNGATKRKATPDAAAQKKARPAAELEAMAHIAVWSVPRDEFRATHIVVYRNGRIVRTTTRNEHMY